MGKFTEEELDMLSPEEREAIEGDTDAKTVEEIRAEEEAAATAKAKEDGAGAAQRVVDKKADDSAAEKEALLALEALEAAEKKAVADKKADTGDKAKEEAEKAAAETKAKEEEDAKVAAEAKAKEEEDAKVAARSEKEKPTAIQPAVEPAFVLESEKKHGTREEIEAKITALDSKFEDGDVTLAAYNKERAGYVSAITEMDMFDKINAQVLKAAAEKSWKDSRSEFFKNNPEYLQERIKNVAYVDAVNRLLATDESKTMTDAEVLAKAKQECDTVFYPSGRGTKTADDKKVIELEKKRAEDAAEKAKAIEAARKAEAEKAAGVKTLANVPVSESNQGDDKYDLIDKLTGDAYETAVARLSDAERKLYAARA